MVQAPCHRFLVVKDAGSPPPKSQSWHDDAWAVKFREALDRRGWDNIHYAAAAKISEPQVSRLAQGRASLERTLQACRILGIAPPDGMLCTFSQRAEIAVARLREYLETRHGFEKDSEGRAHLAGDSEATIAALHSLLTTLEAEVRKATGDPPPSAGVRPVILNG